MIKIETNASQAAAAVAGVSARTMARAFSHSANSAVSSTRTFLLRALQDMGMKRKDVAGQLITHRADPNHLSADMSDRGKRIPLSAFNARTKVVNTARGKRVGVSVLMGQDRQLVPGGFLVMMKSGKVGIFQRVSKERLPIRQMFSKNISATIRDTQGLQASLNAFALESFKKNFARDFEFYKSKENGHG